MKPDTPVKPIVPSKSDTVTEESGALKVGELSEEGKEARNQQQSPAGRTLFVSPNLADICQGGQNPSSLQDTMNTGVFCFLCLSLWPHDYPQSSLKADTVRTAGGVNMGLQAGQQESSFGSILK